MSNSTFKIYIDLVEAMDSFYQQIEIFSKLT